MIDFGSLSNVGGNNSLLKRLGEDLMRDVWPEVHSGGVVLPSGADPELALALGNHRGTYDREGARSSREAGSSATLTATPGSRQTTAGTATAGAPAPEFLKYPPVDRRQELARLRACYPTLVTRTTSAGLWITGDLMPIGIVGSTAWIALSYPHALNIPVRAWAWWDIGVAVGPRHTYLDATICAFEPHDRTGTWSREAGVVQLFDFISVWLVRHMHLNSFGTWPGPQIIHTALERRELQREGELCGCGGKKPYAQCHGPNDARLSERELLAEIQAMSGVTRVTLPEVRKRCWSRPYPKSWEDLLRCASLPQSGRP